MVLHNCAPGAECYIVGAQWLCTIIHRVPNATLVVHNGYCTIMHRVHNAILVVHNDHASLCTGILVVHNGCAPLCTWSTMLYW